MIHFFPIASNRSVPIRLIGAAASEGALMLAVGLAWLGLSSLTVLGWLS